MKGQVDRAEKLGEPFGLLLGRVHGTTIAAKQSIVNTDELGRSWQAHVQ
jgi:hypothetical protein